MAAIQLAYCTFGLTAIDFIQSLNEIDKAGYDGVEISFQRDHFNPFNITDGYLEEVKNHLETLRIKPLCIATAAHFFDPHRPHDPSLMAVEYAARKRRIDLIKRGIHVARKLGVSLVTFGSGFIREEHLRNPHLDPGELLTNSIHECLAEIKEDEDITLLIEPEPGMYIETMEEALALIKRVNSPKFRLHIDICHAYCSEENYIEALGQAAPFAKYLHVSDALAGYNLKVTPYHYNLTVDTNFASYLVHFSDTADFFLLDPKRPTYFYAAPVSAKREKEIIHLMEKHGFTKSLQKVDYSSLFAGNTELDDEIFTWMISIPKISFDVLERIWPIAIWLRQGMDNPNLVNERIANTLTGIVHYHEIPGEGTLDLEASFKALADNGFKGPAGVELYHHTEGWEEALEKSYNHLSKIMPN